MKKLNALLLAVFVMIVGFLNSCSDDDVAPEENEEEIITDVILTFTPTGGGTPVVATAQDPDGEGPQDIEIVDAIALAANTEYTLTLELENSVEGESITEEVEEESDQHMFFFSWTQGLFADPEGDGNVDDRTDDVNYMDFDNNQLPLGLETIWTTGDAASGTFRVVLKHQPPLNDNPVKTATSTANDGESDVDLAWDIEIQ